MRIILLTALTMSAFAANSVLNRLGLAEGAIGPSAFAMIRVISGALMLAILVFWQDRRLADFREVSLLSTASLALYVLGFSYAYVTLQAGIGALILFGGVQITMFIGALIAGERLPPQRWLGAAIAFSGLAYLLSPGGTAPDLTGSLLMAAAALGWGLYSLYGRKISRPLHATGANFLLAVPIALVVGFMVGDAVDLRWQGVVLAMISGALTSGLGYALWYTVLPMIKTSTAAVAQLTVPLIATAGGLLFLAEAPSWQFAIASVLILGGVVVSILK